ncbi:hypothetical protein E9531_02370 [Lampropedia puyangensis]|uniref:Glycoside hydrolase family 42 N-terminal domain-containing protein n=1 Tax=Lampropedia puyangensis TaxID=1330072 RepID=A0A4S8FFX3_9BURK|nr:hypothetical protein [Lampropedia puyangensis]THU05404.1 hypothetical protein E9531_02370 [Lampropedia puyangensis]
MQRQTMLGYACALMLLVTATALCFDAASVRQAPKLFLAPMVEVTDSCILPGNANAQVPASLESVCTKAINASAAALIAQTLAQLPDPAHSRQAQHRYELGYTLAIPLLQLYAQDEAGQWRLQQDRINRFVRTLRDSSQQAIVYLFATHFSAHAAIEKDLAQDDANLAQTSTGPIAPSDYLGSPLYAWSVARTDNPITLYRREAMKAVINTICESGEATIEKVRGMSLLGEVHQLFPNFATGTGFTEPYRITDYSQASIGQWHAYLQSRFGTLARFNRAIAANITHWDEIDAPRSDILTLPRQQWEARRTEHIDAYSHGLIPVGGWAFTANVQTHAQSRILVYVDGEAVARLPINQGRQDVLDARPDFGDRSVGWQTFLDYSQWSNGPHTVQVYLQAPGQTLQLLISKTLQVNTGIAPTSTQKTIRWPHSIAASKDWAFYVDLPREDRPYLFNPLASIWHAFRQEQVNRYLRSFSNVLDGTCLAQNPLYLHQIIPHTNPGWDPQKFAIQRTLQAQTKLRLGVSLYGESSMSEAFLNDLNAQGQHQYGVTEFHPLKPLSPQELERTLEQHRRAGASFFSFFMEPVWENKEIERAANPFSLSPKNPFKGSDKTYESLRDVLRQ